MNTSQKVLTIPELLPTTVDPCPGRESGSLSLRSTLKELRGIQIGAAATKRGHFRPRMTALVHMTRARVWFLVCFGSNVSCEAGWNRPGWPVAMGGRGSTTTLPSARVERSNPEPWLGSVSEVELAPPARLEANLDGVGTGCNRAEPEGVGIGDQPHCELGPALAALRLAHADARSD